MSRPIATFRGGAATVSVGEKARVVGTLSTLDWTGDLTADIVEVRYDRLPECSDWLARCAALQEEGRPVLLTARLATEGGNWMDDDHSRLELYTQALSRLAAVDVELRSAIRNEVAAEAKNLGKACIVSYHNFNLTPEAAELRAVIEQAQEAGSVVKVSTMIRSPADIGVLESLLAAPWKRPLCVIGMGEEWAATRLSFARLGSCLTYGYVDHPAAPGQLSAAELSRRLAAGT